MCGIVGMAGKLASNHKDIMSNLLTVCSLRGMHSTGVFMVKGKDHDISVAKVVGPPVELFNTVTYDRATTYNASILAGHCRAATAGAVNRRNAHPFENDALVGMHNGTLQNWRSTLDDATYFDVDSECLLHNIGLHGPDKVLSKTRGAYALVWFDKARAELNFIRNSQRPLYWCQTKDKEVIFWASEYWMLDMLRSEHGKNQEFWEDKDGDMFFSVPKDTLVRYKIDISPQAKKVFTKMPSRTIEGDSSQPTYKAPFHQTGSTTTGTGTPPTTPQVPLITPSSSANKTDEELHWSKVWQDQEWIEWDKANNPPPLITDQQEVKERGRSLREIFKDRLLKKHTSLTSNRITQIGPIPRQRAAVVTTVVGNKNTLTSSTKDTEPLLLTASSVVRNSSRRTPTPRTNTLTLVSNNKDDTSESSKKLLDMFVNLNTPQHPSINFNGRKTHFDEFYHNTGGCCCSCDQVITQEDFFEETTSIAWVATDSFICNDCNTIPLEEKKVN